MLREGSGVASESGELNYELPHPPTKWPPGVPSSALGVQPLQSHNLYDPGAFEPAEEWGEELERRLCALADTLGVQDQ